MYCPQRPLTGYKQQVRSDIAEYTLYNPELPSLSSKPVTNRQPIRQTDTVTNETGGMGSTFLRQIRDISCTVKQTADKGMLQEEEPVGLL